MGVKSRVRASSRRLHIKIEVNAVIGELYAFIGTVDNPRIDETHYVPGSNNEQCTGSLSARLPFKVVIEAEAGLLGLGNDLVPLSASLI